jgi:cytochrome b561
VACYLIPIGRGEIALNELHWWESLIIVIVLASISGLIEVWVRGKEGVTWRILQWIGKAIGFLTYLLP